MEETEVQNQHSQSDQERIDSLTKSCKAVREELSKGRNPRFVIKLT